MLLLSFVREQCVDGLHCVIDYLGDREHKLNGRHNDLLKSVRIQGNKNLKNVNPAQPKPYETWKQCVHCKMEFTNVAEENKEVP